MDRSSSLSSVPLSYSTIRHSPNSLWSESRSSSIIDRIHGYFPLCFPYTSSGMLDLGYKALDSQRLNTEEFQAQFLNSELFNGNLERGLWWKYLHHRSWQIRTFIPRRPSFIVLYLPLLQHMSTLTCVAMKIHLSNEVVSSLKAVTLFFYLSEPRKMGTWQVINK